MYQAIRRLGAGIMWVLGTVWFARHAVTGYWAARAASGGVLVLGVVTGALEVRDWIRLRLGRRRAREPDSGG